MANEYFRKVKINIKYRNGYRQYPFSLAEFLTPGNTKPIASGMVPDGDAVYNTVPCLTTDLPVDDQNSLYDPPFVFSDNLGTGVNPSLISG